MRKLLNFFSYERKPCMIMEGLTKKAIPVNYGSAMVDGMVREAQAKIWQVAARTTEPEKVSTSHANWMTEIQVTHAETIARIAELEHSEIMQGVNHYKQGLGDWSVKAVRNS